MIRNVTRWCLLGVVVCVGSSSAAFAQQLTRTNIQASGTIAAVIQGQVSGLVRDDHGQPLAGAVVSALGATTAFAVSDRDGRFVFRNLPAGPYLVRAHLQGYVAARGRIVAVSAGGQTIPAIALTKSSEQPSVLAAGIGATETTPPSTDSPAEHDHDELAWRLRHLKRSVLKDEALGVPGVNDDSSIWGSSLAGLSRAVGTPARLASALFADVPFNTQINFLTTTSFDRPQDLFSINAGMPHGIAYVSVVAPTGNGEWAMRGTMTQGDLSSWIVAGSYQRQPAATHRYETGLSYSMQRYLGGNAAALAAMRDGSRNAGAVYAYDDWRLTPRMSVGYGGKYARYDYLTDRGLFSPRASIDVQPSPDDPLRIRASFAHSETAPGAEEFIPPTVGLWLPPERTFSALSRGGAFVPERMNHVEVAVEREIAEAIIVGARVFQERVEDQAVTLFGRANAQASSLGHYFVGSAGDVDAHGWGLSVSRTVAAGLSASVEYAQINATWLRPSPDAGRLSRLALSALRSGDEEVHDLTASMQSLVAATATRIRVIYKLNSAFTGAAASAAPGVAGRFDVQVNQALPFLNFTSGQWEMLVAVRNLFRDDLLDGSVYDELLVVRPPKRVLGGVTVRF